MAYIDTPRTDAGNATFAANGIEDISFEKSFISPKKRSQDLVSQMRSQRGQPIRTPSARTALANRPNPVGNKRSNEFTPLMQSVTKRNALKGKENAPLNKVQTPVFLKSGHASKESPALSNPLGSSMYGSEQSYLADNPADLPQLASSSAVSTPIAPLPKGGQGVLEDQRNLMTLREQENIIDKVEKENFGLKLKIHFLEDLLRKSDPNLNQNAVKENTDLRVDKVQMQKELAKVRKSLNQSEKLAETLRQQMRDSQARAQKDQADKQLKEELATLRQAFEHKQSHIEELKNQLANDPRDQELGKLHDDIEDLEAEVREKQRLIDSKDDELDILSIKLQKAKDLEQQVAESKEQDGRIQELEETIKKLREDAKERDEELEELQEGVKDLQDAADRARTETNHANEKRQHAERERQGAVDDLEELRGEMADKSFTTKGFNRQLEEKATKYESECHDLREDVKELQEQLQHKSHELDQIQDALEEEKQDSDFNQRQLQDQIYELKERQDDVLRNQDSSRGAVDQIRKELRAKTDEKDLLQSRHDTLTAESQDLQRDLTKCRKQLSELQEDLEEEKQSSLDSERALRDEVKRDTDRLSGEVSSLQRKLESERGNHTNQQDIWSSERLELQLEKEQAEQRAIGLQRTVERLQASQGSLSTKESQLQQAIESEQQRHQDERSLLSRQIDDLSGDLENKRKVLDDNRSEILRLKEEQRITSRDREAFQDKIQALEDEVEVLQIGLEEDSERAKADLAAARQETEVVRRQLLTTKQEIARLEPELADARLNIEAFQGDLKVGQGSKEQLNSRIHELENQITRLRNDKQILQDEVTRLETARADAQNEIDTFQVDLRAGRGSNEQLNSRVRDLESQLVRIRSDKKSLQDQLASTNNELETLRSSIETSGDGDASILRRDLATSRAKEVDYSQKEAKLKDDIRGLRREISQLERRVHDAELAQISAKSSPDSSILGSARKSEIIDLRRQLNESQSQSSILRRQLKDAERKSREQLNKAASDLIEHQADADVLKEQLEGRISELELQLSQQQASATGNGHMVTRLRSRIATLEKELKESRTSTITESQMATERADLHRMLQETKLEAEDMAHLAEEQAEQLQVREKQAEQLSSQLHVVREECVMRQRKTRALDKELSNLQKRYESKLHEMATMQELYEAQQDDLRMHVRFADDTVTDMQNHLGSTDEKGLNQRQEQELAEVRRQLEWMRAKLKRENSQRNALVYEKQYLEKEIETFEAWHVNHERLSLSRRLTFETSNRYNLIALRRVVAKKSPDLVEEKAKRTVRQVGLAILFAQRLHEMARDWARTERAHKSRRHKEPQPKLRDPELPKPREVDVREPQRSDVSKLVKKSKLQSKSQPKPRPSEKPEDAPTPRMADLKQALLAENKAASELIGQKLSSKDFNSEDAEKLIIARAKTMKSLQNTSLGQKIAEEHPNFTKAQSEVSVSVANKSNPLANHSQQPLEDSLVLPQTTEELQYVHEPQLHNEQEITDSTRPEDRTGNQDDACVTINDSTFDLLQLAGQEPYPECAQQQSSTVPQQQQSVLGNGKYQAKIRDEDTITIDSNVSDWYHRTTSRREKTPKSLAPEPSRSEADRPTSTTDKQRPSRYESSRLEHDSREAQREKRPSRHSEPVPANFERPNSQREKRKSTLQGTLPSPLRRRESQREKKPSSNDTRDIFAAFDRVPSQRLKATAQHKQPPTTTQKLPSPPPLRASHASERKSIYSGAFTLPPPHPTMQDPSTSLSLSSIRTSELDADETTTNHHNTATATATATDKNEWWARIKEGSEVPFQGKLTVKWKGYVAARDPAFAGKGSAERDEAVKRAMGRLAGEKVRGAVWAREDGREVDTGTGTGTGFGRRRFQGRAG